MHTDEQTNEYLMAGFQATLDERIFEKIVRNLTPSAFRAARAVLNRNCLAEDAVQEAFLRVVRQRNQYDPKKPFAGWFFTILRNICIDMLRKDRKNKSVIEETLFIRPDCFTDTEKPDILSVLNSLNDKHRAVLDLRIVHSMSFCEIAEILEISEEAAKKRAQRGLSKLREKITEEKYIRQAV